MSRYHSYLNSAGEILRRYKGDQPFAYFIKEFFRQRKKYGSTDRKFINELCYCYFRLGKAFGKMDMDERIKTGLFFCSSSPNELLEQLAPEWNRKVFLPVEEKCSTLNARPTERSFGRAQCSITDVFPWGQQLSEGIDHEQFSKSFFIQPDLFLRLRPGYESIVMEKLSKSGTVFRTISDTCLALPNASKIETLIELDKEAVVQDENSQRVGEVIEEAAIGNRQWAEGKLQTPNAQPETLIKVWDCCAGSGGKSILATDILGDIDLTVSDVRESILINLKTRFAEAGIKKYHSLVANLAQPNFRFQTSNFKLIIVDAPCSGSGTWSRTPEQLYFFKPEEIDRYNELQKKITGNVIPYLDKNGFLLYITCSVFKRENEEVVSFIREKFNLELLKMEVLKGYDKKADSMFAALFTA